MSCSPIKILAISDSYYWDGAGLFTPLKEDCGCTKYRAYAHSYSASRASGGGKVVGAYNSGGCGGGGGSSISYNYGVYLDIKIDDEAYIVVYKRDESYGRRESYSGRTTAVYCTHDYTLEEGVTEDKCCTRTRKSGTETCGTYLGSNPPQGVVAGCYFEDPTCTSCSRDKREVEGGPCPYVGLEKGKSIVAGEMKPKDFYDWTKKSVDAYIKILDKKEYANWGEVASLLRFEKGIPAEGEGCSGHSRKVKVKVGGQEDFFKTKEIKKIKGQVFLYYGGTLTPCCVEKIEDFDGTIEKTYSFSLSPSDKITRTKETVFDPETNTSVLKTFSYHSVDVDEIENKKYENWPEEENQHLYLCTKIDEIEYLTS